MAYLYWSNPPRFSREGEPNTAVTQATKVKSMNRVIVEAVIFWDSVEETEVESTGTLPFNSTELRSSSLLVFMDNVRNWGQYVKHHLTKRRSSCFQSS